MTANTPSPQQQPGDVIDPSAAPNRPAELQLIPGTPGIYEVAGIAVQELVNNETALKLLLHTFRQSADENIALRQQQNFDKSEISRIQQEKQELSSDYHRDSMEKTIGSVLTFFGSIPLAFGVNILTSNMNTTAGWACLIIGVGLCLIGLLLSVYRIFGWKKKVVAAIRYVYDTEGQYVGFLLNGYLFNRTADYLGFIRSANQVFSKDGNFVGYLLDDDRIVRRTNELPKLPLLPPLAPMPPLAPIPPLNRFPSPPLPIGYEDVFVSGGHFKATDLSDFSRFVGTHLMANDGTFLGTISKNSLDKESISNKYSHGSRYANDSIFNRYGKYGGKYSDQSPFNIYAKRPPLIRNGNKNVAVLSLNKYAGQGLERVDPARLLLWLGRMVPA